MWGAAPILAASSPTLTSTQVVEIWVTAAVSGILAYLFAVYSRRVTGTYPWRVPAVIWGIFGVLIPVFSLLLEGIARLTTRPVTPPEAGSYFAAGSSDPPVGSGPSPGSPADWQPSQPGAAWQPPPSWQPPQWQSPGQPPQWQPPSQWQPPGSPGAAGEVAPGGATEAAGSDQPRTWTPGSPGAPAAPSWPPPLGPDAFTPPAGQGYPGQGQGYPGPAQGQGYPVPGQGQGYPGQGAPQPPQSPPPAWQPPSGQARPPAPPQLAIQGPNGWNQPLPYVPAPAPPPLFGWYPDPTGRHEQRYWDGRHWSHRVSDEGVRGDDPLYPVEDPANAPSGSNLAVSDAAAGPQVPPEPAGDADEHEGDSSSDEAEDGEGDTPD